jgi:CBS domain-containing protein
VTARELMNPLVMVTHPDDPAAHAVETMAEQQVSGLPVVSPTRELVGIITERDLLLLEDAEAPALRTALYGLWVIPDRLVKQAAKRRGLRVGDLMTKKVIAFKPDDEVMVIARTMYDKGINRVPIVDDGNKVVGIISRADIMRVLAETGSLR